MRLAAFCKFNDSIHVKLNMYGYVWIHQSMPIDIIVRCQYMIR